MKISLISFLHGVITFCSCSGRLGSSKDNYWKVARRGEDERYDLPRVEEMFAGSSTSFVRKTATVTAETSKPLCYSCMSRSYIDDWHTMMRDFYPPINFTNDCTDPDTMERPLQTVRCNGACVTIIERHKKKGTEIDDDDLDVRYIRGCVKRILLFGLEAPLIDEIAPRGPQEFCRVTKKEYIPFPGQELDFRIGSKIRKSSRPVDPRLDLIVVCSCLSDRCNKVQMFDGAPSNLGAQTSILAVMFFCLFSLFLINS